MIVVGGGAMPNVEYGEVGGGGIENEDCVEVFGRSG